MKPLHSTLLEGSQNKLLSKVNVSEDLMSVSSCCNIIIRLGICLSGIEIHARGGAHNVETKIVVVPAESYQIVSGKPARSKAFVTRSPLRSNLNEGLLSSHCHLQFSFLGPRPLTFRC